MDYEIDHIAETGIVRIKVNEPITAELVLSFTKDAINTAGQHGSLRYLVDVRRAKNVTGTCDQYSLAYEEMERLGLDRASRIAVLISPGDTSHDFIETVFRNAGYDCQLFLEEGEADAWLMS